MAGDFTVRVEGLRQLERNWLRLGNDVGFRSARNLANVPLRNALRDQVEPVIRNNTPVDSGGLRESINTPLGRGPRRSEISSGTFNRNVVVRAETGWFWRGRSLWFQSLAVEFGTRFQAPQSVLRNALQSRVTSTINQFSTEFGSRLENRASQLGRTGR